MNAAPALSEDGLFSAARLVPSPNSDERPDPADITLAVVHCISLPPGEYGGGHVERLFTNRLDPVAHPYFAAVAQMRVSAHFLVERGGAVVQFVPCRRRAWHAGESRFGNREACNDFSVGIEMEGTETDAFEDAQYAALESIARALLGRYPIGAFAGHSDIAPGRKTDPGAAFDWNRLFAAIGKQYDRRS